MAITTVFFLFPGLISYSVFLCLKGRDSQSLDKMALNLAFHSAFVFFLFFAIVPFCAQRFIDFNPDRTLIAAYDMSASGNAIDDVEMLDLRRMSSFLFLTAFTWGFLAAYISERRWIEIIFDRFELFRQIEKRSSWYDFFVTGAKEYLIHIDLKDGRRISGAVISTSLDVKDGGIALENVYLCNMEKQTSELIAKFAYVRESDIESPIYFN